MNIRQKCAAAIAVSLAISTLLNVAVLRILVFPSFIELENHGARSDIHRAVAAIEAKIANTSVTVSDYAIWDDTYTFALEGGEEYLTENYAPAAIAHLRLSLVSIHDRNGKALFEAAYEPDMEDSQPAGPLALSVIDPQGTLLAPSDNDGGRRGLLMTARGPLIVSRLRASLDGQGNGKLAQAVDELKSPTGSPERTQKILQFVELSCKRAAEVQAGMIEEMKSVAQDFVRIENILRDLDRFSRSRCPAAEVALIELVRDIVSMLPKYPDIEVVIRIDPGLEVCPPVAAEPFVLKHVVQNLIVNAIEAMTAAGKTRGTITIHGAVTSHGGAPCIDLQVEDEGIGIAADKLDQIFDRGYSTKTGEKRGTGLHWCANSMLAMGGQIRAQSPGPQQGATMHLIIPTSARRAKEAA